MEAIMNAFPFIGLDALKFKTVPRMTRNLFFFSPPTLHLPSSLPITLALVLILSVAESHWESKVNRKQFFDSFADSNGFDPQVPENWSSFDYPSFIHHQVKTLVFQ